MKHVGSSVSPYAYAAFRILFGLLFAIHGSQKLFGVPGGHAVKFASMAGAAGIIELSCGLLIAAGLLTRIAAFIACGEMAFAYFMVHAPKAFLPIVNQGELAVLYCFAFLFIAAHGSGPLSLDRGK
jgi:putative oxidoreductase